MWALLVVAPPIKVDRDFGMAFAKSQLGAGVALPIGGTAFLSVKDRDKPALVPIGRSLIERGFRLLATGGTADYLAQAGLAVERINKVQEGRPDVVDALKNGNIQLVINTTEGARAIADSFAIRQATLTASIPYYTTVSGARAAAAAIAALAARPLEVRSLQAYFKRV